MQGSPSSRCLASSVVAPDGPELGVRWQRYTPSVAEQNVLTFCRVWTPSSAALGSAQNPSHVRVPSASAVVGVEVSRRRLQLSRVTLGFQHTRDMPE